MSVFAKPGSKQENVEVFGNNPLFVLTGSRVCSVASRLVGFLMIGAVLGGCITDISVARHPTVALSNTEAQQILAEFSSVVNTADSPSDIACATDAVGQFLPAFYVQEGNVTTHSGPDVINGQSDFLALIQEPGYVKVVSAINWCGDFGPNIIGCAPIPGNTFAVVRIAPPLEGSLWAHEFGHTVGLEHRNDNSAVMRGTLGSNTRELNLAECEQFLDKVNLDYIPVPLAAARAGEPVTVSVPAQVVADGAADTALPPINSVLDFVRQVYPHGTPLEVLASAAAGAELPALRTMLLNPAESVYWGNVVVALGMLGDASDVPSLIQFADSQAARPDDAGLVSASAALMALGYLANRTGDATALAYLSNGMQPAAWQQADTSGQQLAVTSHIGMAFSGQMPVPAQAARGSSGGSQVISQAMSAELQELSAQIASRGVRRYYRDR